MYKPVGVLQAEALKEENDSLRCQLDAYRNEVELLKQEQGKNQPMRSEEDSTHSQQLSFLQQALQGMQKVADRHSHDARNVVYSRDWATADLSEQLHHIYIPKKWPVWFVLALVICPHFSFVRTLRRRRAAAAYRNGDLFVFIGESITALLFISACLETNDLLISLITSLWTAEMDGLNKEVDTQTGCLCPYVGALHHRAAVQNVNA